MNDPNTEIEPAPATPPLPLLDSSWIISIEEKLEKARKYKVSSTVSIYRVPKSLRNVDQTAYTPKIVSLGPYHHGRLEDMDQHKWRALHCALNRAKRDVRPYLYAARSLEDRARACYEAPLSISSDAFVQSLVLDAIFALELLRGVAGEGFQSLGYAPDDPVFADRDDLNWLTSDMFMLENQLPLFVLDSILALQIGHEPSPSALDKILAGQLGHEPSRSDRVACLALHFFHNLRPTYEPVSSFDLPYDSSSSEPLHCLDVFHRSLIFTGTKLDCARHDADKQRDLPLVHCATELLHCLDVFRRCLIFTGTKPDSARHDADKQRDLPLVHCATELRDAGIKFRPRESDKFWNIAFKDGVLQIPRLIIQDGTKSLFRNLIAFEHCHLKCGNHITSYVSFMDNLINSEEDVRYLHKMGIIVHGLGNDGEVADLFNRLCEEVVLGNDSQFSELSKQVNEYYKVKWNNWRAMLHQKYFSNPWTIISLIAAVVLLLLTAAQTFYAVYGYHKPNN